MIFEAQTMQKEGGASMKYNKCTRNVVHYFCVSSAGDVKELVDVRPHRVALLCAHVQAPFEVRGVGVDDCLDLL